MKVFTKTDKGLKREENQDNVWGEMLSEKVCAAVLCDGMGGESRGGLASKISVELISGRIKENYRENMGGNSIRNLLISSINAANSLVRAEAEKNGSEIMGTTCVAAIIVDGNAFVVNVGDSRGYRLFTEGEDECIQQVTKDHSHVRELVESGQITAEQAKTHPERNKITRAIGAEEDITPDYFEFFLKEGDMLLLCSDGLSSYGDDMDILDICFDSEQEACCNNLVDYANSKGGNDNISVALIVV